MGNKFKEFILSLVKNGSAVAWVNATSHQVIDQNLGIFESFLEANQNDASQKFSKAHFSIRNENNGRLIIVNQKNDSFFRGRGFDYIVLNGAALSPLQIANLYWTMDERKGAAVFVIGEVRYEKDAFRGIPILYLKD